MRGVGKEAEKIAAKRRDILEKAYELFSQRNIESVSLQDIANETGYGIATLYRYFANKPTLVIEAATLKWKQFGEENRKRRPSADFAGMTAAQIFEFYLDSFLELYRNHKDLLRFNQFFNMYVQAEHIEAGDLQPYREMIGRLKERFHSIFLKAELDHTIRTDEPEEEVFSKTLHLMLAAVTRYAVGLVYIPEKGFDAEKELLFLKELLLRDYRV